MNKKFICILVCLFVFLGVSFAQTMTRFGVVDTARVYSTYFRDSAAVRNYEQKKAEFQKKINEKTEELKTLNQKMIDLNLHVYHLHYILNNNIHNHHHISL